MISSFSAKSPESTGYYLQHILKLVLHLYCVMLALQLPLILFESPVNHLKIAVWCAYLIALTLLVKQRGDLTTTKAKTGLFLLYYSYLAFAVALWPQVNNSHYFLLLSLVIAGFVFTRHERFVQHSLVATASLLYAVISTLQFVKIPNSGLIQYCNDLTLGAICICIYVVFQRMALRRWQKLRTAHIQSVSVLTKLLPNEPHKPDSLWPLGVTRKYSCVTVLFADLAGYTHINRLQGDDNTLKLMKTLFDRIDQRAQDYGLEKIKTNGDQYIAIGSLSSPDRQQNCSAVMNFAIALHQLINNLAQRSKLPFQLRIGIATGPVNAGILGSQRPQFDVWGQTVNLAAFLEQSCSQASIRYCTQTEALLDTPVNQVFHRLHSPKHPGINGCYECSPINR